MIKDEGLSCARLFFVDFLNELSHQDIINILDQHHHTLVNDIIKTYDVLHPSKKRGKVNESSM